MKILKNSTGLYFSEGAGFTADAAKATRLSCEESDQLMASAVRFGFSATEEEVTDVSYAVCYIRETDIDEDGNVNPNALNPSRRRFASRAGAETHGRRFNVRKSHHGAAPGSAGHLGFYIKKTNDPVNSAINLATGLTVPANGAPKTYEDRVAAGAAFLPVKDVLAGVGADDLDDDDDGDADVVE
jgi:hypothetical protein